MTAATMAAPAVRAIPWPSIVRIGLLGAVVAVYACLVGVVPVFNERPLVANVLSLGEAILLGTMISVGYLAALRTPNGRISAVLAGGVAGFLTGVGPALLVVLGSVVNLRGFALHASPVLYDILTFGIGTSGFWVPVALSTAFGAAAAAYSTVPAWLRSPITRGALAIIVVGLFAGLLRTPLLTSPLAALGRFLFAPEGLTPIGAVIAFGLVAGSRAAYNRADPRGRYRALTADQRRIVMPPLLLLGLLLVAVLPLGLGNFVAQVIALVALYVLMGLGLNITLGLAGLLDLGFVAFFAVGAYTVGLFTSLAEYGLLDWPFWAAVPFAVVFAMLFGAFLGLPILGIRGDYLAIATLGFGEIIRILAGSDLLKGVLGGPRGITTIPKPIEVPPDHLIAGPTQIYYIALVFAAVIAFVALRLRSSRLGRAWIAIREDEDVAEALGINLVQTKLLAYMLGAAFAGLGGAVFAGLVGSIFPSSINLFVSINVAALIIVGGMGSIPGVILGAIFLIGLPELFREFSEYRYLFYGIALIAIMQLRPEGLWPSRVVKRELHDEGESATGPARAPSAARGAAAP